MFSDVWSENAALLERLMEIYSNPPILWLQLTYVYIKVLTSSGAVALAAARQLSSKKIYIPHFQVGVLQGWCSSGDKQKMGPHLQAEVLLVS